MSVFDATTNETKYVPWELKEIAFKNSMGFGGVCVWNHLHNLGVYGELGCAFFVGNMVFRTIQIMSKTVHRVDLHKDGKNVTFHPKFGAPFTAKIKDVKKLRHEKSLVETFEESYLFPLDVAGKQIFLQGNGHEAIKNGEIFRAVINGQSIKL